MSRRFRSFTPLVAGLTLVAANALTVRSAEPVASGPAAIPGAALPVEKTHIYAMSGKIRPLLFWIGRDHVGMARIVWRRGADGARAYELLIGTDPASAPRRLNRWGYIAEEVRGANGALLALMSRSEETSIDEVRDRRHGRADFGAMRARVEAGWSHSVVPTVSAEHDPTFRDVDALIAQVHVASERAAVRAIAVPVGVRPGFLAAVAELVDASVETLRASRGGAGVPPPRPVPYVYGVRFYDLALRSHARLDASSEPAQRQGDRARGRFEIRNRATGELTRFELVYGLDGVLAAVPIEITYQPRWWLKVALRLQRESAR